MSEKSKRIVFRDADGQIRWFSTDQIELVWADLALITGTTAFGEFHHLALLPGNQWVLYDEPTPFDSGPSKVRFVSEGDALNWLLQRGHEPPACLEAALNERCVVKPSDKRNENLLHVLDEDDGSRPVVIDVSEAQQWGPRSADSGNYDPIDFVPEWFYSDTLYRLSSGRFVRVRERSHREVDLPFEPEVKRFSDADAARWLLFEGFEAPADIAHLADKHRFNDKLPSRSDCVGSGSSVAEGERQPLEASEELRPRFRDPDNYWRNVWLYEQRKAGKTNAVILAELGKRASEFAPLESENALRAAIDAVANFHRWPAVKGRAGRPKVTNAPPETPQWDFEPGGGVGAKAK